MNKALQKFLSMFLVFTLVLALLPALELPVIAASAADYAVTYSAADSKYAVTPAGSSASEYQTFKAAVSACSADINADGTTVVQLGTAETPLTVSRSSTAADNALASATYIGNVEITDATIADNLSSYGLVVPANVTAAFRDFTLTNATATASGNSYYAVNVAENGTLNIGSNTNLSINGKLSDYMTAADYTVNNWGTLNIHGSGIQIKGGTAGGAIANQNDCTLGGNDGDSITVIADPASLKNTIRNDYRNMNIGQGVAVNGVQSIAVNNNSNSTLTISGGTVTTAASAPQAGRTIDNQGTLNITGGAISYTGTFNVGRALWAGSGTVTISGGTLTSCIGECIFSSGSTLNIGGDCRILCTNGDGVSKYNSSGSGSISVSGNAVISGTECGLKNGDYQEVCAATISGGTISGRVGVKSSGILNISGGTISGTGGNTEGIENDSSTSVLTMTDGTVTAGTGDSGAATGIAIWSGTAALSGGSITAKANKSGATVYGISCSGSSSSSCGTLNFGGTAAVTADANGFDSVTTIGVGSQNYGVTNLTGGTVSSTGTTETSSAVCDMWRSVSGTTISDSAVLRSASGNTVLLSKRSTSGFWYAVKCFGVSYYSIDTANISLCGSSAPGGSGLKLLDSASAGESVLSAAMTNGYIFVSWTRDSAYTAVLGTQNGALVSDLTKSSAATVYLHSAKVPAPPASASFTDQDTTKGKIGGILNWTVPSTGIADITGYKVFWGTGTSPIGEVITTVSSGTTAYTFPSGTAIPENADSFLVCTYNEAGNSTFTTVKIGDRKNIVTLTNGSLGTTGDTCITGLPPGFGYSVFAHDNGTTSTYYTQADGTLSAQIGDLAPLGAGVTHIGGGSILLSNENEYSYTVDFATVGLTSDSLGTAGNTQITGLSPGLRYAVFDRTAHPNSETPDYYVKADGSHSTIVGDIAPLNASTITGLINGHTYTAAEYAPTSVFLSEGSLGTAGNCKITDLTPGIRYAVFDRTAYPDSETPDFYVKEDGSLSGSEGDMAPLAGTTEITSLVNGHTYTVIVGQPFLTTDSLGEPGYNKITGLESGNEYYFCATVADDMSVTGFVAADGSLAFDETGMAPLSGSVFHFDEMNGATFSIKKYTRDPPLDENFNMLMDKKFKKLTSPVTLNDWTFKIVSDDDTVVSDTTKYFSCKNSEAAYFSSLFIVGDKNAKEHLEVSSKSGKAFSLSSFVLGANASGDFKIVGYLNGTAVPGAEKTASVTVDTAAPVTFSGSAWQKIDSFRIVPVAETSGLFLRLDNLIVGESNTVPASSYSVSGTVQQDGSPVFGATVKVRQGSVQFGATVTTDADGKFTVMGVPNGEYNLVVTKGTRTVTEFITVNGQNCAVGAIILSDNEKQSVLDVTPGTPNVVVNGLDQEAENQGEPSCTITMKVEKKEASAIQNDASAIKIVAGNKTIEYLKIDVTKTVGGHDTTLSLLGKVQEIVIPYDFSGKADVTVYRCHDGTPSALTALSARPAVNSAADGTFYADSASGKIYIYANQFSTYAVGYKTGSETGGLPSGGAPADTAYKGLPYYLDGSGRRVFIGFSSDVSGTMKYIAPNGKTVLFAKNPKAFNDISGHWAKSYIDFVTERELFAGTGSNIFSPDTGMTRAMFATVIGRLYECSYGVQTASRTHTFTDCDYGSWYGLYINWCAENKIIEGIGGGRFEPNREITRQEMAAILYRFAEFLKVGKISDNPALNYPDAVGIADWAAKAALYCQQTGIMEGRDGGKFVPQGTATRAEVAVIMKRFIEKVV